MAGGSSSAQSMNLNCSFQALRSSGSSRAAAAARDDDVEVRGFEIPMPMRETRDVDARLAHDLDRAGLDGRAADDARARDADLGVAPQLPQPAVGHLAPAVVIT